MNFIATVQPISHQEHVTLDTLVERAREFRPLLKEAAPKHEADRRVSADVMRKLNDAGLLDLVKPARFGGHELGPSAVVQVCYELGRGDGSTAWCAMVTNISAWFVSYWSLQAQKDIWDANPDALVCGVFVPTGKCEVVDGGFRVSGKWPFVSSCENCDWVYVSAMLEDPETKEMGAALFLVPMSELQVDQSSWQVAGLSGTGSKTVYAEEPVFVPAHRMVRFADIHSGKAPGQQLPNNPMSHFWFTTFGASGLIAPLIGMAQGALDWYAEAMRTKARIGMRPGAISAAASPFAQQKAGYASTAIASALALVIRDLEAAEAKIFAGETLSQDERVNIRRDFGFCAQQARAAVDALMASAGASASELDKPIQRFWRDLNAGARHVSLDVDGINMVVGQNMFGVPVTGPF